MRTITKDMIREGIESGKVRFITDPNMESGTVAAIGANWFYFGGGTAEDEEPEEFLKHADMEEVINDIWETMESFRESDPEGEYEYYRLCLDTSEDDEVLEELDSVLFEDIFIAIPSAHQIVRIAEGDGSNLTDEDIEQGYVDYIYYDQHSIEAGMPVIDGGMIMREKLVREEFGAISDCIPVVLEFIFDGKVPDYTFL